MTDPVANVGFYADFQGIAALKRDAGAEDPDALREAARQFESLFARMMLKSMREATFGDSLLGSDQQDFYQGMFDDQFALEMTRGRGLGLAEMLVQQLTRAGLAPQAAAESAKPNSLLNPLAENPASAAQALAMVESIGKRIAGPSPIAPATLPPTATHRASREEFVRELWPIAEQAGRELGVDPRHILAQAALETGWGRSVPSDLDGRCSHNYFGIKAGSQWTGTTVTVRTLEFEDGIPVPRRDRFRAYGSAQESFRDYVALLRNNPRYAAVLNTGADAQAFADALQRGGYATDPAYARKISTIAQNLVTSTSTLKSADARPMTARTDPL